MKKRMAFSTLLVLTMLFSLCGFSTVRAQPPVSQPAVSQSSIPGELVVGFNPNEAPGDLSAQADGVANSIGATVLKSGLGGMSLLQVPDGADVTALSASLLKMPGVKYVEPNYRVKIIDPAGTSTPDATASFVIRASHGKDGKVQKMAYPIAGLKTSKTKKGSTVSATYPTDPSLWTNWGWSWVGADIVWNNPTASKNVCVIDTGVDYLHPDLAGKVVKGFDFVNYDLDPMDDYGHGTHVAGIIAAVANNKQGIAGVSTGKIVAVKVLDANGDGSSYDVAQGIRYCAGRSDVNILSLSLGGSDPSISEYNAVDYAVNTMGKLVVAAAGNDGEDTPTYPAYYANDWPTTVLAVGAAGKSYTDSTGNPALDQNCQADYSNFGSWVKFVAPGTAIYSTTPWDKPFTMNTSEGVSPRYATLSGTSMATPFVSAVAARAWGYKPALTNSSIATLLYNSGWSLDTTPADNCWDTSMSGARLVSVSAALDRGGITLSGLDANTDLPLVGATVSLYQGTTLKASAIITSIAPTNPVNTTGVDMEFTSWADMINLPAAVNGLAPGYTPKINATNYTASTQNAFVDPDSSNGTIYSWSGYWEPAWAVLPQKSANFSVVGEFVPSMPTTFSYPALVAWLPAADKFVLNPDPNYYNPSYELPDTDVAPYGSMSAHPFARWINFDWHYQALIIRNRPAVSALPYYPGVYLFGMTDRGAFGDPNGLDQGYASVFVWKDGVIKYRVDKSGPPCGVGQHWWYPLSINSNASGSPIYTATPAGCGTAPYTYP